jgi:phage-related protein (TIGR01555 family)
LSTNIIPFDDRTSLAAPADLSDWLVYADSHGYPYQIGVPKPGTETVNLELFPITLTALEIDALYVRSQPVANAIDVVVNDGLKYVPKIIIKSKKKVPSTKVLAQADRLLNFALPVVRQGAHLARKYGWAVIKFAIDDGACPKTPFNPSKAMAFTDFRAVAGGVSLDASVCLYCDDPDNRDYGQPLTYNISPNMEVHASRVALMRGLREHRPLRSGAYELGYSVAEPVKKAWDDYQRAIGSIDRLLDSKSLEVFGIENFKEILRRTGSLQATINALKMCREQLGGYLVDKTTDFQLVDRSLAGIADAMEAFIGQMSCQANLPDTIIMGVSPAGQTSGEYEKAILQKLTSIWQCLEAEPVFRQILDNYFAMQGHMGLEYELEFSSTVENTEAEKAEISKNEARGAKDLIEAIDILKATGLITAETANLIAVKVLTEIGVLTEQMPASPLPTEAIAPTGQPIGFGR